MSRIGKQPVTVPSGVKVSHDAGSRTIAVEGPKGKLSFTHHPEVEVRWDESDNAIVCAVSDDQMRERRVRALWGTTRSRIQNLVDGVTKGYEKKLEIVGVGWNAQPQGKTLRLNIGFCHPIDLTPPDDVNCDVQGQVITISGPDKQAVGQFAAVVRSHRPPEPYKGKGIRYVDEYIIRKQGKVFGS